MKLFIKNILDYYKSYKFYSAVFFFGVVFGLMVESLTALSFKFLLDNAIMVKDETMLYLVIILLVVGTVIAKIAYILRFYLYSKVATGITRDVRNALFKKLQNLSLSYYARIKSADILSYFSMDLDSLELLALIAIPASVAAVLGIVINILIIFVLEWQLAIVALIGLILCVVGPSLFSAKVASINDKVKLDKTDLLSIVEENIGMQEAIRAFNLEKTFLESYIKDSEEVTKLSSRSNFLNKMMEIVPNIIIQSINVAIICIGAYMAYKSYITAGTLVAFNSLFIGLSSSVMSLTRVIPLAMKSSASLKRIWHFLDEEEDGREGHSKGTESVNFRDKIKFSNVSFAYDETQMTLSDINLEIPKGASIALVGPSGSGKSSIINLFMGFYDMDEGCIEIDGVDSKEIDVESVRQLAGIVAQENHLFNTSIRRNFELITPLMDDEEMIAATEKAKIHDYIMALPKGYETIVGDRGRNLSNGQRQRVAIARALLYNPSMLIFDDATSVLDHKTEQAINELLKNLTPEKTIVNVTHRLENIQAYDCIYVLNNGKIVESGKHDSLMALEGFYSQLYGKQKGFNISDDFMNAEIEVERLAQIKIFENFDKTHLKELKDLFVSEYYSEGQRIIQLGESGDRFYIIVRGKVDVSILDNDGNEQVVTSLEDGDYFGEIALLRNVARTAHITAKTPSLVLSLKRAQFEGIVDKSPHLKETLEAMIDTHLEELEDHR